MPATGAGTERLASGVVAILTAAEAAILARFVVAMSTVHTDDPQHKWTVQKQFELSMVRAEVDRILNGAYRATRAQLVTEFANATTLGRVRADKDLNRLLGTRGTPPIAIDMRAVTVLADELSGRINDTRRHVLRGIDDVYRDAAARAIAPAIAGVTTRREATLTMALDLAQQGIPGFVDKAGKTWTLDSYAEMATRTAMARTTVTSHLNRFGEAGHDLVQVNAVAHPCEVCWPWQSAILSISGDSDKYPSVSEAHASGLQHPGCKHMLSLWVDGLTAETVITTTREEAAAGYKANQGLRAQERTVRGWGRRLHAAEEAHAAGGDLATAAAITDTKTGLAAARQRLVAYATTHDVPRKRVRETPFGGR